MNTQSRSPALISAILLISASFAHSAQTATTNPGAVKPVATTINKTQPTSVPLALQSYDPVGYFMHAEAMKGVADMQAVVDGKTYRFVMADHINLFKANPGQYLPQFDGLCAFCLAKGEKKAGDPAQFTVVGSKLYFNADAASNEAFKKNPEAHIALARAQFELGTSNTAANKRNALKANLNDSPTAERMSAARYTAKGELIYPANVENWVVMGASLGMGYNEQDFDPKAPGSFVVVSMEPMAYEYFKKHGHFADGTLFTRSAFEAAQRMSTNRAGFVMGDFIATEMHIVDRKKFKDGFNFAIFGPKQKSAPILPDGNGCVSCHVKNAAYEGVFAQFYPTIRERIPAHALAAAMLQEQP